MQDFGLDLGQRMLVVIRSHQRHHGSDRIGRANHRVRACDRNLVDPPRFDDVAEVDQAADRAIVGKQHVVIVGVVVNDLPRLVRHLRRDLGCEVMEHGFHGRPLVGVIDQVGVAQMVCGEGEVPQMGPPRGAVIETDQFAIESAEEPAERRARHCPLSAVR